MNERFTAAAFWQDIYCRLVYFCVTDSYNCNPRTNIFTVAYLNYHENLFPPQSKKIKWEFYL